MKTKNLLSHLTDLEGQLNHFSFEELTSQEASKLKESFMSFKYRLEEKVLGPNPKIISSIGDHKNFDRAIKQKPSPSQNNILHEQEGRLIAKVDLEIRTPINGIIESVDILKESNLSAEQLIQLNTISNSSNNLLEIINELLEYSKLTTGQEKFETIDFNFYSIIRDTMFLCNTLLINKDVALEVDIDTEIPEILTGDPSKLSQILLTLFGNLIKDIDKGSILLKVVLGKQHKNIFVLDFEISEVRSDTSENNLKITKNSIKGKEVSNTGNYSESVISMEIVKSIIEILNGSTATTNIPGEGNTFKFTIPYTKENQKKTGVYKYDPDYLTTAKKNIEGMHILVFEDNMFIQKLVEQRLKNWGCVVHITDNGLEGIDYLQKYPVNLILMDLQMPVMSGFQITQKIRDSNYDHVKNIPIIALTGDFTIKDKKKCHSLGINDYILKPYSPDELLAILFQYKKAVRSNPTTQEVNGINHVAIEKESWGLSLIPILEECMGEIDLLEELIALFKQNMLEFIGRANIYLPQGNFNHLGFAAHKIKSGLSMMKEQNLFSMIDEIVVCCRTTRDLQKIGRIYDQILLAYPKVEKAIDWELELLKNNRN